MKNKICRKCKEKFKTDIPNKLLCDDCCKEKDKREFNCWECRKTFLRKTTRSRRKYCFDCRPEKQESKHPIRTKICKYCQNKFKTNKPQQIVCNDCRKKKDLENQNKKSDFGSIFKRKCKDCKKFFEVEESTSRKQICSNCRNKRDKNLKRNKVEKVRCCNCKEIFETDLKSLKCLNCKTLLFRCEECNNIFKRSNHYSHLSICKKCLPTKKEIEDEFLKKKKCVARIIKEKKLPPSYVYAIVEKIKKENNLDEDFVSCKICEEEGIVFKRKNLRPHLTKKHKIKISEYKKKYNAKAEIDSIRKRRNLAIKKSWELGDFDDCTIFNDINSDEIEVNEISEKLVFVGGSKKGYKRFWIRTSRLRNPDFIVINNEEYLKELTTLKNWFDIQNKVSKDFQLNKFKTNKVIEYCGLHWHQYRFNGKTLEEYEKEMISDYNSVGFNCLVVWDFELRKEREKTIKKIKDFVK